MSEIELTEAQHQETKDILALVVGGQHVVLTHDGVELAGMIPMVDLDNLHAFEDEIDNELADQALAEPGESILYEDVRQELGLQ